MVMISDFDSGSPGSIPGVASVFLGGSEYRPIEGGIEPAAQRKSAAVWQLSLDFRFDICDSYVVNQG